MELKDLIFQMVNDKAPEFGNNVQNAMLWLCEFAAQPDSERQQILEDYKATKKSELQTIKTGLAAQKLRQEQELTAEIGKIDNTAVELAEVVPTKTK